MSCPAAQQRGGCCSSVSPGPAGSEAEHLTPNRLTYTPYIYIYTPIYLWPSKWINTDRKYKQHHGLILFPSLADQDDNPLIANLYTYTHTTWIPLLAGSRHSVYPKSGPGSPISLDVATLDMSPQGSAGPSSCWCRAGRPSGLCLASQPLIHLAGKSSLMAASGHTLLYVPRWYAWAPASPLAGTPSTWAPVTHGTTPAAGTMHAHEHEIFLTQERVQNSI